MYEYALVSAFTRSPFGGNPALIVFLDTLEADESVHANIAKTLNQPIACFVAPVPATQDGAVQGPTQARYAIRYYAPAGVEVPLCGHGTLATVFALLDRGGAHVLDAQQITFSTRLVGEVSARRVRVPGAEALAGSAHVSSERIEIELPLFTPTKAGDEEFERIRAVVAKAFRKTDVQVMNVAIAETKEDHADIMYVVEVAESEDLGGVDVDTAAFAESAPYYVNIVTSPSSKPGVSYTYRMFAPRAGVPEDHVCGSANCLMAPYWAEKLGTDKMFANQVSKRGGELWIEVDEERKKVRLQGEAAIISKGQVFV